MKFTFDHDYHMHSQLSKCSSDPEQTTERLLQYAKDNGLTSLCVTDHVWDSDVPGASEWYGGQNFPHIFESLPLPEADGIKFYFGCEGDMDKHLTLGIAPDKFEKLDFIIVPTTHLHMTGFTIDENDAVAENTAEIRAGLWKKRISALLDMDLPFAKMGLAHPACRHMAYKAKGREEYLRTIDLIPDEDIEEIFSRIAKLGMGVELNKGDMAFKDNETDTVLRMFRIAKSCGCKFYLGCDVHRPKGFSNSKEVFERAIDLLELTENDKYHIPTK